MKNNKINVTHNMSYTRFYKIWQSMKIRCYNKKAINYCDYGARGISICKEWLESFENFRDDMYKSYLEHVDNYGEKDTSIDRIDVNKDYYPKNCKWATKIQQSNNRRVLPTQKLFKAVSSENIEYIEINQRKFAREHDLDSTSIIRCLQNKIKQHKGYRFNYVEEK